LRGLPILCFENRGDTAVYEGQSATEFGRDLGNKIESVFAMDVSGSFRGSVNLRGNEKSSLAIVLRRKFDGNNAMISFVINQWSYEVNDT
jgi:hypothetical protein